ncbi:hypothetical protein OCL06_09980 [Alteromonas sp. ASW11-19]|uniref:Uncharacterized protein n=1 Tax=Alteromonas salexigens TaxID=2982530 RepID=A0ABT2VNQ3_9ALTE|nr:hypothetical protein [Alteromonas salexigens]MCU7554928.1 hypothetical protein [Alteromonas salexigens]
MAATVILYLILSTVARKVNAAHEIARYVNGYGSLCIVADRFHGGDTAGKTCVKDPLVV